MVSPNGSKRFSVSVYFFSLRGFCWHDFFGEDATSEWGQVHRQPLTLIGESLRGGPFKAAQRTISASGGPPS